MSEEKQTAEQVEAAEQEEVTEQAEQAASQEQHEETAGQEEALQHQIDELQGLLDEKETSFCVFKQTLKTINDAAALKWKLLRNTVLKTS